MVVQFEICDGPIPHQLYVTGGSVARTRVRFSQVPPALGVPYQVPAKTIEYFVCTDMLESGEFSIVLTIDFYRPPTKFREGNVFSRVVVSVCPQGWSPCDLPCTCSNVFSWRTSPPPHPFKPIHNVTHTSICKRGSLPLTERPSSCNVL